MPRPSRLGPLLAAAFASLPFACGGSSSSGPTYGSGPDGAACPAPTNAPASGYPAVHAAFPQVTYQDGGIITSPAIVTVTFPGDALEAQLQAFGDTILDSCWWNAVREGYCEGSGACAGTGSVAAHGHVGLSAPAGTFTDSISGGPSTMQQYVQQQVASGALPAPGGGTIYALYFPATTTIELDGQKSCVTFGGYHNTTTVTPPGGKAVDAPYVVVPRCGDSPFIDLFQSQLDEVTFSASHEITEAITDPNAGIQKIGFYLPQVLDSVPWNEVGGGEVGDLCVDYLGESQGMPGDQRTAVTSSGSYTVQRIWSNAAAAAGGDPCVPAVPGEVYFNAAIAEGSGALQLAVGESATFEVDAFSTGPLTWDIEGQDLASLGGHAPIVSVTLSASTAKNGDKLQATVKLVSTPPDLQGTKVPGEPYLIVSRSGSQYHLWPGVVLAK